MPSPFPHQALCIAAACICRALPHAITWLLFFFLPVPLYHPLWPFLPTPSGVCPRACVCVCDAHVHTCMLLTLLISHPYIYCSIMYKSICFIRKLKWWEKNHGFHSLTILSVHSIAWPHNSDCTRPLKSPLNTFKESTFKILFLLPTNPMLSAILLQWQWEEWSQLLFLRCHWRRHIPKGYRNKMKAGVPAGGEAMTHQGVCNLVPYWLRNWKRHGIWKTVWKLLNNLM